MLPWAWKSKKLQWKCWPRKTNRQDYCWTLSANLCINHLFDRLGWSFKKCPFVSSHSFYCNQTGHCWLVSIWLHSRHNWWLARGATTQLHSHWLWQTHRKAKHLLFSELSHAHLPTRPQGPTTISKPASVITLLVFLTYLNSILKFGCTQASFISFCLSGK